MSLTRFAGGVCFGLILTQCLSLKMESSRTRSQARIPRSWNGSTDWLLTRPGEGEDLVPAAQLKVAFLIPGHRPQAGTWDLAVAGPPSMARVMVCAGEGPSSVVYRCRAEERDLVLELRHEGQSIFLNPIAEPLTLCAKRREGVQGIETQRTCSVFMKSDVLIFRAFSEDGSLLAERVLRFP